MTQLTAGRITIGVARLTLKDTPVSRDAMTLIELEKQTKQRGADAFHRFANGKKAADELDTPALLRGSVLAAVAFAWAVERAQAGAAHAEVVRMVEEAKFLDREYRDALSDQPCPMHLAKSARDARAEIAEALKAAETDLLGVELGLEDVATLHRFDANAVRHLIGATRWRSSNVDHVAVEDRRRVTVDYLLGIFERLRA